MSPKIKVILGILLAISFLGTFITGLLSEKYFILFQSHKILGIISFILVILHLISNWRIIKNFGNILKRLKQPK